MKKGLIKWAIWIDTNDRVKTIQAGIQFIAVLSLALLPVVPEKYQRLCIGIAVFTSFVSLASLAIVAAFKKEMGRLFLVYRSDDGILFDKERKFHNVSLRRDTLRALLKAILRNGTNRQQILQDVGHSIGGEFAHAILQYQRAKGISDLHENLADLLSYDQSSGMGVFEVLTFTRNHGGPVITVRVRNPFTSLGAEFTFFKGYLAGVCGELCNHEFAASSTQCEELTDAMDIQLR